MLITTPNPAAFIAQFGNLQVGSKNFRKQWLKFFGKPFTMTTDDLLSIIGGQLPQPLTPVTNDNDLTSMMEQLSI